MMRPGHWRTFVLVVFLCMTASATSVPAPQSSEYVELDAGDRAAFAGILVSRAFISDLILAAEEGEVAEVLERGWLSAIRLAELRGERIAELERQLAARAWVTRACGAATVALAYLYGQERGENR